jgi:hypothetical protein
MSVSTISSASSSGLARQKHDLQSLVGAAQSGDQTRSKRALAKFERDTKSLKVGGATKGLKADLSKLNGQTKAGGAKAAATVVESDIRSAGDGSHHDHASSTDTGGSTSHPSSTASTDATDTSTSAADTSSSSDAVNSAVASYVSN